MRSEKFMSWMINQGTMGKRPMGDAISRCRRIERDLGIDLDNEYLRNKGIDVIAALDYSIDDALRKRPLPGNIELNGNAKSIRDSMATLKAAAKKYFIFCEEDK